jgi:molecular chaperone GrpE
MPRWPAGKPPDSRKKRGDMANESPEGQRPFAAEIAEDAVAAALRSVERLEREKRDNGVPAAEVPAPAPAVEAPAVEVAAEAAAAVEIPVEPAVPEPAPDLAARIAALEEELAAQERLLEESQRLGRETMARLKETNDRYLRAAADLENYKKRAQREKEEVQKFGIERLLKDLLPVLDNFDRALDAAPSCTDVPSFAVGVEMTRKLFEDTLGRHGVKSFRSLGETFDPRIHEAVQGVESAEHPANVIVQEIVRGFFLHDRLVRPSMVVVSRGPGPAPEAPKPEAEPAPAPAQAVEGDGKGEE